MATMGENYSGKPGDKLSGHDRTRLLLAFALMKNHADMGKYTAIKNACIMHPAGLPDDLAKALAGLSPQIGKNVTLKKHLTKKLRDELQEEANRLEKARKTNEKYIEAGYLAGDLSAYGFDADLKSISPMNNAKYDGDPDDDDPSYNSVDHS
jgi:hypothetical protein